MSEHGHQQGGQSSAGNNGEGHKLARAFGLGANNGKGQNFLSHLLGLDHDPGKRPAASSQNPSWNSALQNIKISDAFQGIALTPNVAFVFLFVGFVAWLYVIYWIRHHEPLANSVLGTAAAQSSTAAADRKLVAGIKYALPFHTTASTGDFYVPCPGGQSAMPLPGPPVPPQPAPPPKPTPLAGATFAATPMSPAPYQPHLPPTQSYAPTHLSNYDAGIPVMPGMHGAYMVPVSAAAGTRVKMIVNR